MDEIRDIKETLDRSKMCLSCISVEFRNKQFCIVIGEIHDHGDGGRNRGRHMMVGSATPVKEKRPHTHTRCYPQVMVVTLVV
jgi:hypothetical protein